jgi:hypothetical protein
MKVKISNAAQKYLNNLTEKEKLKIIQIKKDYHK